MGSTGRENVNFVPKVWNDHIQAYFDREMGLGKLALVDKSLTAKPGDTTSFPYYKAIGRAQKPAQNEGLIVEPLVDDSFSITVQEAAKAVGWKDAALMKSAATKADQESEAQRQMGRVLAEEVDIDLIAEINKPGSYVNGTIGTVAADNTTVSRLLLSKIMAFGDKQANAVAIAMHSLDFAAMMTDTNTGFLKADANHPFYGSPGYQGTLLGMALFVLDTVPQVEGGINGRKAWYHFMFKAQPFGISVKQDLVPEFDRDILHRENIATATMWYGVLSLNQKVSAADKRIARGAFASLVAE